ncbi:UNVERIFIED_CONTAM: hypothetical protein RMT77_003913 [Armadillidium vulgare]
MSSTPFQSMETDNDKFGEKGKDNPRSNKLMEILEDLNKSKEQLEENLQLVRNLRVSAAQQMVELLLIYDPEIKRNMESTLLLAEDAEVVVSRWG